MKKVRWECPNGHPPKTSGARVALDDVRRYCLTCSEQTGVLVKRRRVVVQQRVVQESYPRLRYTAHSDADLGAVHAPIGQLSQLSTGRKWVPWAVREYLRRGVEVIVSRTGTFFAPVWAEAITTDLRAHSSALDSLVPWLCRESALADTISLAVAVRGKSVALAMALYRYPFPAPLPPDRVRVIISEICERG